MAFPVVFRVGSRSPPWMVLSSRCTGTTPNPYSHGEGPGKWKLVTCLSSARIHAGLHKATGSPPLKQ